MAQDRNPETDARHQAHSAAYLLDPERQGRAAANDERIPNGIEHLGWSLVAFADTTDLRLIHSVVGWALPNRLGTI